jgi:hypothetical protein
MHHLDLGLYKYQLEFTKIIITRFIGSHINDEIDSRISTIPRHQNIKTFHNGIQSLSLLTADKYRSLIKIMVFVIDNLFEDNINIKNKELIEVYVKWNNMYILTRKESFSENDLIKLEVNIIIDK